VVCIVLLALCVYNAADAAEPTPRPEPIEMLDAVGVDASLRVYLQQGSPWVADIEDEILLKMLHRLPDFPLQFRERWAFPWDAAHREAVVADPSAWQGQFFRLPFTVSTLEKVTFADEVAQWFGFDGYYRLQVELDDASTTVFARTIPQAWQKKLADAGPDAKPVSIDQPGSAVAMFLKTGATGQGSDGEKEPSSAFYFAAERVAWHPETVLGRLGMDAGLFDLVEDQKSIGGKDREPFYQLLAAVGRAKPGKLMELAKAELGKGPDGRQKWTTAASLFNTPEQMRGHLALLVGNVRRAVRVEVRDPDIVERFGIRYYYELYLFTADSQDNPIVVCVRDLPKGMPTGSGTSYCQRVEVAGIMLKSWAFTSKANIREGEEKKRQLAPLLIGREPVWIRYEKPADSPWPTTITVAAIVFVLFILWYFLRRQAKADRAAKQRRREKMDIE
jgi:hypothetical protein